MSPPGAGVLSGWGRPGSRAEGFFFLLLYNCHIFTTDFFFFLAIYEKSEQKVRQNDGTETLR